MVLIPAGIFFFLFAAGPVFADYSGHVASFKSETNAIKFTHKMKAKGLVAFYRKENVPGKGELYRSYIGGYKTSLIAREALTKLKKAGDIDYFKIQEMAEKKEEVVSKKIETAAQKNEPARKPEDKTASAVPKPEAQTASTAQKSETQNMPSIQKPETQPAHTIPKPENKVESSVQTTESKTALSIKKQETPSAPSIDTHHYYEGIKGIVLKNGKVVKGQIISIDDNDILKIRTKKGKILSYSFVKEVKEYITE
jgi:hypothetical protein